MAQEMNSTRRSFFGKLLGVFALPFAGVMAASKVTAQTENLAADTPYPPYTSSNSQTFVWHVGEPQVLFTVEKGQLLDAYGRRA